MATLECPDCAGVVSDQADNCPHCGRPIQNAGNGEALRNARIQQIAAALVMAGGFVMLFAGNSAGGFVMLAGLIWTLAARFRAGVLEK